MRRASLVLVLATLATAALAHHSFAMFDQTKIMTVKGTVKDYQWTNPHVWIVVVVQNPQTHETEDWGLEGTSTSVMTRRGWTRRSLTRGDEVAIDVRPLKDGSRGGAVLKARVGDREIGTVPPAGAP